MSCPRFCLKNYLPMSPFYVAFFQGKYFSRFCLKNYLVFPFFVTQDVFTILQFQILFFIPQSIRDGFAWFHSQLLIVLIFKGT